MSFVIFWAQDSPLFNWLLLNLLLLEAMLESTRSQKHVRTKGWEKLKTTFFRFLHIFDRQFPSFYLLRVILTGPHVCTQIIAFGLGVECCRLLAKGKKKTTHTHTNTNTPTCFDNGFASMRQIELAYLHISFQRTMWSMSPLGQEVWEYRWFRYTPLRM